MGAQLNCTLGIARPIGKAKTIKGGAGFTSSSSSLKLPNEIKQEIFKRDNHTCKCCGFTSQKYQEVHFLNNNKADQNPSNLATVCIFCHQCFNLGDVSAMRSGVLIWLPEITQTRLNHIARAIYVARISQGPMADAARKSLDILMARREEAKNRLGTDDPYILAEVLRDYLGEKHYHFRDKKLEGVRLFPLDRRIIKEADLEFNQFPQILAYWRSKNGPFGGKTPPQWISIYKKIQQ
ncbi:MAG: type IV secretion protein DotN [Alphaproteobacteria bacterium]